ncbi:motility hub landmark protein FimV [Ferrigenium sp. UT4]
MLKTIFKKSGLVACWLLACSVANATGLGGITVTSNLGQPLRAEIELLSVDKADRSNISAKLAAPEMFKRAGVDFPYELPRLKFEIVDRETDRPRIKISTLQPVNEPFVTLLVEVMWSSGKLLREYTFLLDPIGFNMPAQPAAEIIPVAPAVPAVVPAEQSPQSEIPVVPNEAEAAAASAPAVPVALESEAVAAGPAEAVAGQAGAVPADTSPAEQGGQENGLSTEASRPVVETQNAPIAVVRGDTLSKIALKTKPAEVSLERMLVALYRANTEAFSGKNMNRLRAGKIIRLPDAAEIEAIGQREAKQEYRAQVREWNSYRQQLAAARAQAVEQGAAQAASGKVTAAVAETATAPKEPAKEILKLSKGQAPGDTEVAGKSSVQAEDAIAREKALQDAQERAALLEKNVKDLQRLDALKREQAQSAVLEVPASASAATSVVNPAPAAVKPVAKPAVPAPLPVPEKNAPSFLDELLEAPIMLGGGVVILLLLLVGGVWLSRRRTLRSTKNTLGEDEGSTTGRITVPVVPSPETGDFTHVLVEQDTAVKSDSEDVDPIAEADLFLSFGRDVQAEEVLKDALADKPGDLPITLKLLAIYANRKDAESFLAYARQVQADGDESAWNQVAAMGRALEPNNPLYGGDGESVSEPPAAAPAAEAAVDFDLGFGGQSQPTDFLDTVISDHPPATAQDNPPAPENRVEKSNATPQQESTTILSADELRAAHGMAMDFDVTGTRPPVAATDEGAPVATDDLIFDVTATNPGRGTSVAERVDAEVPPQHVCDLQFDVTAKPEIMAMEKSKQPALDEPLAFTLDIPDDSSQAAPAETEAPLDIGLGDISLNLGGIGTGAKEGETGSKDERWQEVATKLDLAKAYQEMGDAAGAREILDEVMRDGDEQQRANAQAMLAQL